MDTTLIESEKALKALANALGELKSDIVRDAMAPKTVVREMAQNQLIDDVDFWLCAIDQRNLSSHTFNCRLSRSP